MKKLLFILFFAFAFLFAFQYGHAQTGKPEFITLVSTDTSTNGDTVMIAVNRMPSKIKSFQVVVKKVSGAVGGYVLLQATDDSNNWFDINTDTLTNANQTINHKKWDITATSYKDYRAVYRVASGTQRSTLSFSYVRRPDE